MAYIAVSIYNFSMHSRKIFRYKGARVNIFGIPVSGEDKKYNKRSKKGKTRRQYLRSFGSDERKDAPKVLLLMYDIPHTLKHERDWFRRQLKNFDFMMIQKSVWVGPSPLSKDFLDYLKRIGLRKNFKTFKLAKAYTERKI